MSLSGLRLFRFWLWVDPLWIVVMSWACVVCLVFRGLFFVGLVCRVVVLCCLTLCFFFYFEGLR